MITFFPLPSPSVTKSPTMTLVRKVRMWGGPASLTTSKYTWRFLFRAIS